MPEAQDVPCLVGIVALQAANEGDAVPTACESPHKPLGIMNTFRNAFSLLPLMAWLFALSQLGPATLTV